MRFLRVHKLQDLSPPGKLYDQEGGSSVYNGPSGSRDYLIGAMQQMPDELKSKNLDYFIGISWGHGSIPQIDFFAYSGVGENWKGNPDVNAWVIEDGIWHPTTRITCGRGFNLLFGREEELRRHTPNREAYLGARLNLNQINEIFR